MFFKILEERKKATTYVKKVMSLLSFSDEPDPLGQIDNEDFLATFDTDNVQHQPAILPYVPPVPSDVKMGDEFYYDLLTSINNDEFSLEPEWAFGEDEQVQQQQQQEAPEPEQKELSDEELRELMEVGEGGERHAAAAAAEQQQPQYNRVPQGIKYKKALKLVWEGKYRQTRSGLTKDDLTLNRAGQVVSKARQRHGLRRKREGTFEQQMEVAHRRKRKLHRHNVPAAKAYCNLRPPCSAPCSVEVEGYKRGDKTVRPHCREPERKHKKYKRVAEELEPEPEQELEQEEQFPPVAPASPLFARSDLSDYEDLFV